MTSILLIRSGDGCFSSCTAVGHAGFAAKGKDIVCASETLLLRTAVQVLQEIKGIEVLVDASRRGYLSFSACLPDNFGSMDETEKAKLKERLRCVADFLKVGLEGLSQEYPRLVHLDEKIG